MAILMGNQMIAEAGFAAFSARKLAHKMGYTVGTIYNVFGTHECLIASINGHTLDALAHCVRQRLVAGAEGLDQLQVLATAYLDFACTHHQRWSALFEAPRGSKTDVPDWYLAKGTPSSNCWKRPCRGCCRTRMPRNWQPALYGPAFMVFVYSVQVVAWQSVRRLHCKR